MFGGTAGEAYDACHGSACDNMDNISQDAFLLNARAMASVAKTFANTETLFAGATKRSRSAFAGISVSEQSFGYDKSHGKRHLRPVR